MKPSRSLTITLGVIVAMVLHMGASAYSIAAIADRVTYLPLAQLRSKMFSGFLDVGGGKHIHYIFTESESSPADAPVVFWTNGGPGCSGLLGFTMEHGPWRPAWGDANASSVVLVDNPYAWNKVANVIYLEQPAGVGYSYAEDAGVYSSMTDGIAAGDNTQVVRQWYARFPQYRQNDFYISSESYGGHSTPQLVMELMHDRNKDLPRLKGALVGNPYTSFASGDIAGAELAWNLQLLPKSLWDQFQQHGCDDLSIAPNDLSHVCWGLLKDIDTTISHLNPYALEFPTCSMSTHKGDASDNKGHPSSGNDGGGRRRLTSAGAFGSPRVRMMMSAQKDRMLALRRRVREAHASDKVDTEGTGDTGGVGGAVRREGRIPLALSSGVDVGVDLDGSSSSSSSSSSSRSGGSVSVSMSVGGSGTGNDSGARKLGGDGTGSGKGEGEGKGDGEEDTVDFVQVSGGAIWPQTGNADDDAPYTQLDYDPCKEDAALVWLNRDDVQVALHVSNSDLSGPVARASPFAWEACNDEVFDKWPIDEFWADTTGIFRTILVDYPDLRLLIYSGDADAVCATVGTQDWVFRVANGVRDVQSMWAPWLLGNQKGGYLTQFSGAFSFMTVHTAGHEVPSYQPARGLAIFSEFLSGNVFSFAANSSKDTAAGGWGPVVAGAGIVLAMVVCAAILFYVKEIAKDTEVGLQQGRVRISSDGTPMASSSTPQGRGRGGGGAGFSRRDATPYNALPAFSIHGDPADEDADGDKDGRYDPGFDGADSDSDLDSGDGGGSTVNALHNAL